MTQEYVLDFCELVPSSILIWSLREVCMYCVDSERRSFEVKSCHEKAPPIKDKPYEIRLLTSEVCRAMRCR